MYENWPICIVKNWIDICPADTIIIRRPPAAFVAVTPVSKYLLSLRVRGTVHDMITAVACGSYADLTV